MWSYVAGFLFDAGREDVLLIEKQRPAWQRGKLNGVGGKIEPGETPEAAMEREFAEEAGVCGLAWERVADLTGPGFTVYFFAAFDDRIRLARTCEEERLIVRPVAEIATAADLIPNLKALIPLALDTSGLVKPIQLQDRGLPGEG